MPRFLCGSKTGLILSYYAEWKQHSRISLQFTMSCPCSLIQSLLHLLIKIKVEMSQQSCPTSNQVSCPCMLMSTSGCCWWFWYLTGRYVVHGCGRLADVARAAAAFAAAVSPGPQALMHASISMQLSMQTLMSKYQK